MNGTANATDSQNSSARHRIASHCQTKESQFEQEKTERTEVEARTTVLKARGPAAKFAMAALCFLC
jgi:hypothetical protein